MATGQQQRATAEVARESKTGGGSSQRDFAACLLQFKDTLKKQQYLKAHYFSKNPNPIKEFCDAVISYALPREGRDEFIPLMELANAMAELDPAPAAFQELFARFSQFIEEFNRLKNPVRSSDKVQSGVGLGLSGDAATEEKMRAPSEIGKDTAGRTIAELNAEVKLITESLVNKLKDVTEAQHARIDALKLYNEEKNHRHGVQRRIQQLDRSDPRRKQLENYLNEPSLFDVLSGAEINELGSLGLLAHICALNQAAFFDIDFNGEEKKQPDWSEDYSPADTLHLLIQRLSFNGGLKQDLAVTKNQKFLRAFSSIILRLIDKDCGHLLPKEAALIRGAKINERDVFFSEDIKHKEEAYQYFLRQQKICALLAALRELDEITKVREQEAKGIDNGKPVPFSALLAPAGRAIYNDGLVEAKRILETPGADSDVVLEAVLDTVEAVRLPSQTAFRKAFKHSENVNSQSDIGWGFKWACFVVVIALLIFAGIQLGIDPNTVIQGCKAVNVYTAVDGGVAGTAVVGGCVRAYNKKCGLAKSFGFFAPDTELYKQAPAKAVDEKSNDGDVDVGSPKSKEKDDASADGRATRRRPGRGVAFADGQG